MTEHPALFLALAVNSLVWIGIARYIAVQKRDSLHIGVIFSLLFVATYPLKFMASLFGFVVMNPLTLPNEWLWWSMFIFNLSGILFLLPIIIMKPVVGSMSLQARSEKENQPQSLWLLPTIALLIISLSYGPRAIAAAVSMSSDLLQDRIAERAYERQGSGLLALFRSVGEVVLIISILHWTKAWTTGTQFLRLKLAAALSVICVFLLALSGSKYLALLPLFYFVILLNMRYVVAGRRQWRFSRILLYGLVGLALVGFFGYLRGFGSIVDESGYGAWFQIAVQLSNAFDGPDNLTFILARMGDIWGGDLSFAPTLQYLVAAFPRFLWPDKPLVLGNLYIQEIYLNERFTGATGEVIGPSMAGEMLLSGGALFMCVWSILLGLFFAAHYRYAHRSKGWIPLVLYVWLAANVFNLLRSGSGILGAYMPFVVAVVIVWALWEVLRAIAGRRPVRPNDVDHTAELDT